MIMPFSETGKHEITIAQGSAMTGSFSRWQQRTVPTGLAERYRANGWWTDESLGSMVETGLAAMRDEPFVVHSQVRPWSGTFGDIDRAARSLAASLAAEGVGPGDVVLLQLPNWMEAGVTFWATAYLGAVIVPVVHFYGAKEVSYIIDATDPAVVVTPISFGPLQYLDTYAAALESHPDTTWLVVGDAAEPKLPERAIPFDRMLNANPIDEIAAVDADAPTLIGFTSGTTSNPKGVVHTHNTIGFETRQLGDMFPGFGPPSITGAPVGHFIGMLNAFLVPLWRNRPVHMVDVWDPGAILKLMLAEQLGMAGGATYFLTSLLDHPDFTDEHLALMPFAGLGGSTVPVAVMERLAGLGITAYRSYGSTEHPSITGASLDDPEEKRHTTDGRRLPGVEVRLADDGEIFSRGPDCCMGYTDPELTSRVFDDDGWYRTGDVGVLDDDGWLTITDRVSDIIIRGGENISAQEIEESMMALPGVAEVAVVAAPDDRLGERAAAVVRMLPDHATPSLDDVRHHLRTIGLAKQKWPETVLAIDEFPRTPSGKVQKFVLRQQLREGTIG